MANYLIILELLKDLWYTVVGDWIYVVGLLLRLLFPALAILLAICIEECEIMQKKRLLVLIGLLICCFIISSACFIVFNNKKVFAQKNKCELSFSLYEVKSNESDIDFTENDGVTEFKYGKSSVGKFYLVGDCEYVSPKNGAQGYAANNDISFVYFSTYKTGSEVGNGYDIEEKAMDSFNGFDLGDYSAKNGVIIIEKSIDRVDSLEKSWQCVNVFDELFKKTGSGIELNIYTVPKTELQKGVSYRITILYRIKKPDFPLNRFRFWCVETCEIFLASPQTQAVITEIGTNNIVSDGDIVENGFEVNGSNSLAINVEHESGKKIQNIGNKVSFYESGKYTVTETTMWGVYKTEINVTTGLNKETIYPVVYETADNTGYFCSDNNLITNPCFGSNSYGELMVAVPSDCDIEAKELNNSLVGVDSDSIYIMFNLNQAKLKNGWALSDDTWGTNEGETVNGIVTGTIGTGALIIQKSHNGINWELCGAASYVNGVFTTDFTNNYGKDGDFFIYQPSGIDVLNAYHYKILFAYEIYSGNTYRNIVEVTASCNRRTNKLSTSSPT